ncbi:transcriptional regulator [Serratia microhaemolytica]|uniref:transcriptional regulator n=1 Tax=Serratia microhaemolytica TaxID=2675110 RepID=UPI000FDF6365|nr:YdaS family helix-turn-helix protein [Serratia microhaemolytica]
MTPEQLALHEAIRIAGGQSELARKLSHSTHGLIKQQQVWNWLHREKKAPAKHTAAIEKLTGVAKEMLRPDVFRN